MKNEIRQAGIIFYALLCIFISAFSALAQDPENSTENFYQPVRKVDLGVPALMLEPGETYTFDVSFEPEEPFATRLIWFNTDNTVVGLNELTNTVKAFTPGTARLMAESFDGEAYAVCEITVNGTQEKDLTGKVEGKSLLTLSETDRAKITAAQINRRLDLLEMSVLNEDAFQNLQDRTLKVMAEVRPGTEEAESERALAIGMTTAYPMKNLHLVSLDGSFLQIVEFVKGNDDLIRIFKEPDIYIFDPIPESGTSSPQPKSAPVKYTTRLEGKMEELTSVSIVHDAGYTGKGITIAIIDTGLNSSHEQFAGRVIAENCFSKSYRWKLKEGCIPCDENDDDCDIYSCYLKEELSACKGGTAVKYGKSDSAFPGKTPEEYKTMLIEMSSKTADRRNSDSILNLTSADGSGKVFDYSKPVVDFSKFQKAEPEPEPQPEPRPEPEEPQMPGFCRISDTFDLRDLPKTGFSGLHAQDLSAQPLSVQYSPTRLTLQLPTLDVISEIVTVPYTGGAYPVEWLGCSVGMLEGSSLPGEGITVLTGHNHLNTTEAGPFALLSCLDTGDVVMITDSEGAMQRWHVYESAKIPADGFSRIAVDVKKNALVLMTCEDESPDGGYLNRRVVLAEKLQ